YYSFANVSAGTYTIDATTTKPEGGINTTDAAQVNVWFQTAIGTRPAIERVKFNAGDVNNSGGVELINAVDVALIKSHFLNPSANPFPRGVWTFWRTSVTSNLNPPSANTNTVVVGATNTSANFYGLCVGDFNGSNTPPSGYPGAKPSIAPKISMAYQNTRNVGIGQVFEVPVRVIKPVTIGAVSLVLRVPVNMVSVSDVSLSDGSITFTNEEDKLRYSLIGDELRISWVAQEPLILSANDRLLTIKLRAREAFSKGNDIRIELIDNDLNELADDQVLAIEEVKLSTDVFENSTLGVDQNYGELFDISCHPNPFTTISTISYFIPTDGNVSLEIFNMLGSKVATIVNGEQSAGRYTKVLDGTELNPGVYTVVLRFENKEDVMRRTIKLVHDKN
ncbi:MAG: T9SS type A sorting domain-containing protein, partial [Bacteroidota bacterium]